MANITAKRAVNHGCDFGAAQPVHHHRRPGRVGVEHRHAGQGQYHQAQCERQVGDAPDQREALVMLALEFALEQFIRLHVRPRLALLALLVFAVEPQAGMRPEERKGAGEQQQHELGRDPDIGIAGEIVGRAVGFERGKALGRALMTFLAGLEAVVRMHGRLSDRSTRWMPWLPWQSKHLAVWA